MLGKFERYSYNVTGQGRSSLPRSRLLHLPRLVDFDSLRATIDITLTAESMNRKFQKTKSLLVRVFTDMFYMIEWLQIEVSPG